MHNWEDVETIGELTVFNHNKKAKLLQIGRYVRDVCQFVHAFTLRGNGMREWVFDRSGPYSSTNFDIHEEPKRFVRTIAAYMMMSDEELGLDTFIERDGDDRFVSPVENTTGKDTSLQLDRALNIYQRAIVCRGTFYFRIKIPSSKNFRYIVKISWVSDKR